MPARYRTIGPSVSAAVARELTAARLARGWDEEDLSGQMALNGDKMSPGVIRNIEQGIRKTAGVKEQRLITLDESAAFVRVFGGTFAVAVLKIIGGASEV